MTAFAPEILRGLWRDKSYCEKIVQNRGFKGWFSDENYILDGVDGDKNFTLSVSDTHELKCALIQDSFRFGLNSVQSIHSIRSVQKFPKLSSWHLIQAYYAAFFSAHALLRVFGQCFVHFEAGHIDGVKNQALKVGVAADKLKYGNYIGKYDSKSRTIIFKFERDSHRDLWKCYQELISNISVDVVSARATMDQIFKATSHLSEILACIIDPTPGKNNVWLSSFRNDVNYRAEPECWFPFEKNSTDLRAFFNIAGRWRSGDLVPSECLVRKSKTEKFFLSCILVVQLSYLVLDDYSSVVNRRGSSIELFERFKRLAAGTFEV